MVMILVERSVKFVLMSLLLLVFICVIQWPLRHRELKEQQIPNCYSELFARFCKCETQSQCLINCAALAYCCQPNPIRNKATG